MSALLLAAVGDAVGFRGGQWEFMVDGAALRAACRDEFGSAAAVVPAPAAGWPVSDDTCLSMSVARALLADDDPTVADFAGHFWADQAVWADPDRAPGGACLRFLAVFRTVPFAPPGFSALGGGCGAATRALPVGLAVPVVGARLVDLAVSSALPTHWHPGGVLAAVLVAWCAALARSAVHPEEWFRDFTAYMDQGGAAAVTERLVAALAAEATVTAECDRFLTAVRRYCRERLVGCVGGQWRRWALSPRRF